MSDKKHHIVYCTVNLVTDHIYIGVHSTNNVNDGYLGRGLYRNRKIIKPRYKSLLYNAIIEYGVDNFERIDIKYCDSREHALDIERTIVDEQFVNRKDTYNLAIGGNQPPVLKGERNGNYANFWTEEQKQAAKDKCALRDVSGAKNPNAVKWYLYDYVLEQYYMFADSIELADIFDIKPATLRTKKTKGDALKRRYFIFNTCEFDRSLLSDRGLYVCSILDHYKKGLDIDTIVDIILPDDSPSNAVNHIKATVRAAKKLPIGILKQFQIIINED